MPGAWRTWQGGCLLERSPFPPHLPWECWIDGFLRGEGSLEPGEYESDGALANRVYLQQPRSAATGASSELVAMLQRKQGLEQSIRDLKRQRDNLEQRGYYEQLENLLIDLALLTRRIRAGDR